MVPTAYVASTATTAKPRITIALAFARTLPVIEFTSAIFNVDFHSQLRN